MTALPSPDQHDCALEPIRFCGAIQPHGYLISCAMPDWTIRHVSANVDALLDVAADVLLGQSLRCYLDDDLIAAVDDVVGFAESDGTPVRAAIGNIGPAARPYDMTVHVSDGLVHIEFEPHSMRSRDRMPTVVAQAMIARVATAPDMIDFHQRAAEQMRELTGYERVVVYRFLPDGAGEVIAESSVESINALLGLRFPESDIPLQARALYVHNRVRVIPNVNYVPVPIVPPLTAAGTPLDLSLHHLRSVSPMHLEYSRNMGVLGSLSVSIVSEGRLWGLIACHHREPHGVTAAVHAAAELFGLFVSMRMSALSQQQVTDRGELSQDVQEHLWRRLSSTRDLDTTIAEELTSLARVLDCDGVAVRLGGRWVTTGRALERPSAALLTWLCAPRHADDRVIASDSASDWNADDDGDGIGSNGLAGLMAVRLGNEDDWLLYFRNEQIEDVRWAGEPVKRHIDDGDRMSIRPRERFDAWREIIRGRSQPWTDLDLRSAERLRQMLGEFRERAAGMGVQAQHEPDRGRLPAALREQHAQLSQLCNLLAGPGALDELDAARLSARIAQLETELPALPDGAPAGSTGRRN